MLSVYLEEPPQCESSFELRIMFLEKGIRNYSMLWLGSVWMDSILSESGYKGTI